jgi:hypothetical protein
MTMRRQQQGGRPRLAMITRRMVMDGARFEVVVDAMQFAQIMQEVNQARQPRARVG